MELIQAKLFDYQQLDTETRIVVQQEDKEFDRNMGEAGSSFVLACQNLQRIHEALRYKRPGFVDYCNSKPGLEKTTAYKMLDVAKMFPDSGNIYIRSKEALYLLSSPSTPNEARQEALDRAQNGETVTHSLAREIVNGHKGASGPVNNGYSPADNQQEFDYDSHLDAALDDEARPACSECGQVYNGESCPDCTPRDYNYLRDNRRMVAGDINIPQRMDACQTPPEALTPLFSYLTYEYRTIWEPAAGEGYLVGGLRDKHFKVISSDLLTGQNFFEWQPDETWDCIVTNPPYSVHFQWLKRCYELGRPFALLLKVDILGTKAAQELFNQFGIEVIFLSKRVNFKMPNRGWAGGGAQFATAWFTWGLDIKRSAKIEIIGTFAG